MSSNFLSSTALTGYATETWVQNQGYLTSHQDLSSYATQSWVSSNFLSTTALSGYATETWVQNQGYLDDDSDYFKVSSVWTGTEADWNLMSQEEKERYIIAVVI